MSWCSSPPGSRWRRFTSARWSVTRSRLSRAGSSQTSQEQGRRDDRERLLRVGHHVDTLRRTFHRNRVTYAMVVLGSAWPRNSRTSFRFSPSAASRATVAAEWRSQCADPGRSRHRGCGRRAGPDRSRPQRLTRVAGIGDERPGGQVRPVAEVAVDRPPQVAETGTQRSRSPLPTTRRIPGQGSRWKSARSRAAISARRRPP